MVDASVGEAARIERLVVFGVGLIGGSFAAALRASGNVGRVIGFDRDAANLEAARKRGVIDEIGSDVEAALRGADAVLLAVPVGETRNILATIAPYLASTTVITDVGSTKREVVAAARATLADRLACFVPGHPIAGAEKSGASAARADLFRDRLVVLTPLAETEPSATARVAAYWRACGARVRSMTPEEHDALFAAVSHLPHVLAFALVDYIAARPDAALLFELAAGGFRDFTRIAESSPVMWRDICLANRDALLAELAAYRAELERVMALIERGDGASIEALFDRARAARQRYLQKS